MPWKNSIKTRNSNNISDGQLGHDNWAHLFSLNIVKVVEDPATTEAAIAEASVKYPSTPTRDSTMEPLGVPNAK